MPKDWKAGLDDQDEMGSYPSAANPLTAMGVDPDMVRANPEILSRLGNKKFDADKTRAKPTPPVPSAVSMPTGEDTPKPSAVAARATGGAGDAQPSSTSSTPASASPDDLVGYGKEGLGLLNRNLKGATEATEGMSTTPPADVARLSAQQEKLAMPAPRFDPKTGKQLKETQEYDPQTGQMVSVNPKASTGTKVWRGVRGGLVGLLTGGIPGAAVGALEPQDIAGGKAYNAPSKQYEQAEARREQALGATGEELKTAMQTWKDVNKQREDKSAGFRATAALGKDVTAGASSLINAVNKPETEGNKTAAKLELTQQEFEQRQKQLQTDPTLSKLSPLNKALYLANGKVPDPRQPSEGELNAQEIARGMVIFKNSHGGKSPQTLEEFNSVISAAKGDLGKVKGAAPTEQQKQSVIDKKKAGIERANEKFANSNMGEKDSLAEYQRQLQETQNAYEEEMASLGLAGVHNVVTVDNEGNPKWTPQAAPAPATPQPGPAHTPPTKPQPAPDGTRRQAPDGTIEVKQNGKWVKEKQ